MDGMTDGHSSDLSHAVQCAVYDDTLTQDEQNQAHSSVRVDVLCLDDSHDCHVVIGVMSCNRATSPRKHNTPTPNSHFRTPQSNCALVVRLHAVIVYFSCSYLLYTFAPRKRVLCLHTGCSRPLSAVKRSICNKVN